MFKLNTVYMFRLFLAFIFFPSTIRLYNRRGNCRSLTVLIVFPTAHWNIFFIFTFSRKVSKDLFTLEIAFEIRLILALHNFTCLLVRSNISLFVFPLSPRSAISYIFYTLFRSISSSFNMFSRYEIPQVLCVNNAVQRFLSLFY